MLVSAANRLPLLDGSDLSVNVSNTASGLAVSAVNSYCTEWRSPKRKLSAIAVKSA